MSRGRNRRKKLPVGVENFETMIRKDFYYVDKTDLITELLDNWGVVNLFTRPRRFGKSLNMSMLQSFFSMEGDKSIFEGLHISRETDLCAEYMGQYPVVALSLKSVNASTYEDALRMAANVIYETAVPFDYLRSSDRLIREDRERYVQLLQSDMDEATLQASLRTLTRLLEKHHGRKVIVLIDEYDVPLSKAYENSYYDRMVQMLRNMFEQVLKTNPSMEFAVLTGCMRISKESIFTGLNNLKVLSMGDERYAEYFGFTDAEVRDILAYYGRMDRYETVREWYDGYRFGDVSIYCPWDVLNYCDRLRANPSAAPENYWIHSSGNTAVQRFLHDADTETTRQEIEQLIAGGTVEKQLRQELTYREMYASPDNMWSVLFTTGYLTQRGCIESEEGRTRYLLAIPNREIRSIFIDEIMEMFTVRAAGDTVTLERFSSALLNADPDTAGNILGTWLRSAISVRDTAVRRSRKENFYHGILLGVLSLVKDFRVSSNEESGDGYGDILIRVDDSDTGIIIEVKYAENGNLENACKGALEQIRDRHYEEKLRDEHYERILKYGIAFYGKSVCVKMET